MKKTIGLAVVVVVLAACDRPPSPNLCDDFRQMTFYETPADHIRAHTWSSPETKIVCVVSEKSLTREERDR